MEGAPSEITTAAPESHLDALALTGFILSFFTFIIGLVVSIIALVRVKKTANRGKGFAIAGICISLVLSLLATALAFPVVALLKENAQQHARIEKQIDVINRDINSLNNQIDHEYSQEALYDRPLSLCDDFIDTLNANTDTKSVGGGVGASSRDRERAKTNTKAYKNILKAGNDCFSKLDKEDLFSGDTTEKRELNSLKEAWKKAGKPALNAYIGAMDDLLAGRYAQFNHFVGKQDGYGNDINGFISKFEDFNSYLIEEKYSHESKYDILNTDLDTKKSQLHDLNDQLDTLL